MHRLLKGVASALIAAQAVCAARAADISGGKILLTASEHEVHAIYFRAPGDAPRPAALLLHGAGGFERQVHGYYPYASALANQGIDAYLVDYYSYWDEENAASGRNILSERYAAWAKLVGEVADDVEKRKDSNGKVALVGFSNGGILAAGASMLDPDIAAAVIYYGAVLFPQNVPPKRLPPLLVLHGDADRIIPVEQGKELAQLAVVLGGRAEFVIYSGEGHGFGLNITRKSGADALGRTIAFLHRELGAN